MRLRCVRVFDDRVDLVLEVDAHQLQPDASARAAALLLEWLPGLEVHRCSTGSARPFVEEMRDTELAHLLEHAALEVLVRSGSTGPVRGETVWRTGEDAYLVSIFDDDDAVCLAAARLALRLIEYAFGDGEPIDVDSEIERIAALRATDPREAGAIDPR